MNRFGLKQTLIGLLGTLIFSGTALLAAANSPPETDAPGFRPASENADTFLAHLDCSEIAVLPTVIRSRTTTGYSEASQKAVVEFLKKHKLGVPEARKIELNMGEHKGEFQFDWFWNDMKKLGEVVKVQSGADYYIAIEFLVPKFPSGGIAVFGVHIYVLDAKGENAFSFLLNAHHKALVDADLKPTDSSEQSRDALVMKGTKVALEVLQQQIDQGRHGKATMNSVPGMNPAASEMQKLQGTWQLVYQLKNGRKIPDEAASQMFHGKMVFAGDKIHYSVELPGFDFDLAYRLHPDQQPKAIDLTLTRTPDAPRVERKMFGIYHLEDGQLEICHNSTKRPADFKAEKGSHNVLIVLKRKAESQ